MAKNLSATRICIYCFSSLLAPFHIYLNKKKGWHRPTHHTGKEMSQKTASSCGYFLRENVFKKNNIPELSVCVSHFTQSNSRPNEKKKAEGKR